MLNVIEPQSIRMQEGTRPTTAPGSDFTALLQSIAPGASATAGLASESAGVSAVTHAAVTGVATAPAGAQAYNMGVASPFPTGGYNVPGGIPTGGSYGGGVGYPSSEFPGGIPSDPFLQQDYLLNKMRDTNMQMLTLQAAVQAENRDWTTRSQILKAKHDTEMAQVRNLRVT